MDEVAEGHPCQANTLIPAQLKPPVASMLKTVPQLPEDDEDELLLLLEELLLLEDDEDDEDELLEEEDPWQQGQLGKYKTVIGGPLSCYCRRKGCPKR